MDLRKVRENLGRVKVYHLKGETLRELGSAVVALKEVVRAGGPPSTEIRALLREAIQFLARNDDLRRHVKVPLIYQPGQERQMLLVLAKAFREMEAEAGREDHDSALARKRQLDQALLAGQKFLAQGKASEADEAFQTALTHYRNEHRVFQLIGRWLLDAGQPRRAVSYLKKAAELEPENDAVREMYAAALRAREEAAR